MQELIAVRVKDGIFVGNAVAAHDREFISLNKITHVVNCAGGELADLFADDGVKYLTFPWKDPTGSVCTAVMFDSADENVKRTVRFIDEALEAGDCVLVHSQLGMSRSPALVAAYLIVKYGWKLESAISFLEMAHKDMSIKPHFLRQLRMFAKRNTIEHDIFDVDVDDSSFGLDNVQWMLRNTLLNGLTSASQRQNELYKLCSSKVDVGQPVKTSDVRVTTTRMKKAKRLVFVDTKQGSDVEPRSGTPVVTVQPLRQSEPGNHFLGYHGSIALEGRRRSNSIMRHSVSPCGRSVESDPSTNPHGRQELTLRFESKSGRSCSAFDGATSSQAARTASGYSTIDGASHVGEYHTHLPSPDTIHAPARSPFATLTSGHKYRKGSPLPSVVYNSSPMRSVQRPSSALVSEGRGAQLRTSSYTRPTGFSRSGVARSGSPCSVSSHSSAFLATSTRLSSYRNIAPHRSQPSSNVQPAWSAGKTALSPSRVHRSLLRSSPLNNRPGSPVERPSSTPRRVSSPTSGSADACSSRTVCGTNSGSKGGGVGLLRRQIPAAIPSSRS
ncbi:dual specificity protein phosphatase, putative [Trypanosoma equiperdum]|uniref:Dual specificity protein phosphatase, putative n=2 Tax=Trypanozoon TaxID=39700 RepID=Q38C79_TRYB2|nr:dual specificity protein phosphatase, putative [Trypanosoma brucei brucei TREU927]EAN77591.1 dual specificity protein phosphatase, putative [Trypanosoma brucei brucei TREU927]SCU67010.1 dual specificity protein phosphatase, putative [Trypanosoma equiperdum]